MTKNISSSLIVLISVLLFSCGENRDESIKKIKDLESRLLKDSINAKDEVSAYNLEIAYLDFATKFPKDPEAAEYIFKAANLDMNLNMGQKAIVNLDKFLSLYGDHAHAPEALFYKAYIYDNQLNDDAKAGEIYREFIKKYPTHAFAADAEASIRNLGKSNEELIREFEQMNADSTKAKEADTKAAG
jgi:outer membrane protein assembly factor BamD (BamD/ComL family)